MRILTLIAVLLVGSLFIVSGLIKANDPLGFSYKLEEYFDVFADDLEPEQEVMTVVVYVNDELIGETAAPLIPGRKTLPFIFQNTITESIHLAPKDSADTTAGPSGSLIQQSFFKVMLGSQVYVNHLVQKYPGQNAPMKFKADVKVGDAVVLSQEYEISATQESLEQNDVSVKEYLKEAGFLVGLIEWFRTVALELSILICVVEIVLGIALILGAKPGLTVWSLFGLILMFSFLTFYSAHFEKVTDCGCFGDAIKLTPWESFWKDIILLVLILIIMVFGRFVNKDNLRATTMQEDKILIPISIVLIALFSFGVIGWGFPVLFSAIVFLIVLLLKYTTRSEWVMAIATFVLSIGFSLYCFWHLPIKDFRPYAIGKSLIDGRKSAEELGLKPPIYANIYIMTDTVSGKSFEVNSNDYMIQKLWENKQLTLEATDKQILIEEGWEAPIHDFNLEDNEGNLLTDEILSRPYVFLLVSYDLEKTDATVQPTVNAFVEASETSGGPEIVGLTATSFQTVEEIRHEFQSAFRFLSTDGTALKTVIRSNPGLVLLKEGVVVDKWHANDFPSFEEVKAEYLK